MTYDIEFPDLSIQTSLKIPHGSSVFIFLNRDVKLFTIGFIWSLIEYSTKFEFSNGDWFYHYLKERTVNYESMSLNKFFFK